MRRNRFAPIRCEACNKQFSRLEHLRRHCELHRNVKPYKCSICDRRFVRKDAAKRHVATHAGSSRQTAIVQEGAYSDSQPLSQGADMRPVENESSQEYSSSFPLHIITASRKAQPSNSLSGAQGVPEKNDEPLKIDITARRGSSTGNIHIEGTPFSGLELDHAVISLPEDVLISEDVTYSRLQPEERLPAHTTQVFSGWMIAQTSSVLREKEISHMEPPLSESVRSHIISPVTLKLLTSLYFENFHPTYPFIDGTSLQISDSGVLVCLATAAIGACFQDSETSEDESFFLHAILQDLLMVELPKSYTANSLHFLQAMTLHTVGLIHSKHKESRQLAHSTAALTFQLSRSVGVFDSRSRTEPLSSLDKDTAFDTILRDAETRTRTGFFIYMLDTMLAFPENTSLLISQRSLLNLDLPCPDRVWEDGEDHSKIESFTLEEALCRLYMERKLVPEQSEFALTGLIYGVIRCNLDVACYYSNPLSFWTPGDAQDTNIHHHHRHHNRHDNKQRDSLYWRWRDSTCDCLDTLHWEILGRSAAAGGHEAPIFLHLHLARLAILAPCPELLRMFEANSESGTLFSVLSDKSVVQTWLQLDQHKARLAVLHAGAMFWHLRHVEATSFSQPLAIFLAALILWAYGCHEYFDAKDHSAATAAAADPAEPDRMHVDRPFDDELAQLFIRTGRIELYMHPVGKICSAGGPERVLGEAKALLQRRMRVWGVSKHYIARLEDALGSSPWSVA
ncbi:hypothetical protein ASPZODRAFT_131081 [Penicilliopsis zonata CBS 506.65]|uniref:C2H2-type domain-containing protein n=1 Tax=Penicilliopsis zonata CBS 506.65 TaxID=1073090 RepID=A0A1L9SK67_9EURO|nr:hypothetical protein ASPZODRAFT_131081 [Penicilliopsis zonata CBS 506.65]OJJ47557.1 hypothetical protein ASPZODRAFT_131081 [Penicilliopsis zonata CBS 506.65]